jgi:Family of unknown function (DUF5767)
METLDFKLDDLDPINIDFGEPKSNSKSTNFGSGIELLMNDKVKSSSSSTVIDMNDLDDLETELNDLSSGLDGVNTTKDSKTVSNSNGFSNFFGFGGQKNQENIKIITEETGSNSNVGSATVDSMGNTKTWDGFTKMNDVPSNKTYVSSNLSEREKRRKKRTMLSSLNDWYEKGIIKNISHFTMESSYEEIEDEYEGALEDKRKRDAVKLQQNWLITAINTIEYGNAMFNPFDISLDGWGESVSEDIDSYNEIFEQLHEKYKGGKMSPELALLMKLGFSASVIHFTNKTLSTAAPGYADVMRQNPELMRMFTNATVDVMKQSSPGMSFASDLMNNTKPGPMTGFPPAPVETRNQPAPPASARPGMQFTQMPSNRPDINASRGVMFQERGVDMNQGYQDVNQERSMRPEPAAMPQQQPAPQQRVEMNGPKITDIDSILSGLKTKTINIHEQQPQPAQQQPQSTTQSNMTPTYMEEDSMVSISSLKDIQGSMMPKRSNRRKQRSDRNVISLDI